MKINNDNKTIELKKFIEDRSNDIKEMMKSLSPKKKSLAFQRLPYYKRRRPKTPDIRNSPKCKNSSRTKFKKKKKNPQFVYYAKRYKMLKMEIDKENHNYANEENLSYKIPYKRIVKSEKFIYKSNKRGYFADQTFLGFKTCHWTDFPIKIEKKLNFCEEYFFGKLISFFRLGDYVIYQDPENIFSWPISSYSDPKQDYIDNNIIFSVIEGEKKLDKSMFNSLIATSEIDQKKDHQSTKNFNKQIYIMDSPKTIIKNTAIKAFKENIDGKCKFTKVIVDPSNEIANHLPCKKIFCHKKFAVKIIDLLTKNGFILMSLTEQQRLYLEKGHLMPYFDEPHTKIYEMYEKNIFGDLREKYERTPKAKRINYEKLKIPFFELKTQKKKFTYLVNCIKFGNIERGFEILDKDENKVGVVLRGSFCFTIGKSRGYVVSEKELNDEIYFVKNFKNNKKERIEITRKF